MATSLPRNVGLKLDHSAVSTYQICKRRGMYEYALHRVGRGEAWAADFGTAYHHYRALMEADALSGADPRAEWKDAKGKTRPGWQRYAAKTLIDHYQKDPPEEHRFHYLTRGRLWSTMKQGFEVWEKEQLRGDFEVLAVETAFSLALPSGRIFQGRIDRTIRYRGRLYVGDFKTTGRMGAYYEQRFDPSNQMTGYCWALQKLSGETPAGVIIDTVYNTKKQGPTHHRGQVSRNQADIDAWVKTIEAEYDLIEMCHAKNSYPMNTASCFMYGECPYRQACLKGDNWKMIDHWLITQCIERVWDPLTMEATSSPE